MTTSKDSIFFLQNYCRFEQSNYVWILTGIVRNKDNNSNHEHDKWMRRLIIRSPEDILSCYNDIKAMGNAKGVTYRMYVSLNARDVTKAFFDFQHTLITHSCEIARGDAQIQDHIKRLDSVWKTVLLQTHNRATKRFLLDVDSKSEELLTNLQEYLDKITKLHVVRETVSGYHIVFDACDTRGLMDKFKDYPIDLQRDSLLFVETWEGEK